jgi:2-dehydropantoate 2-reductase
MKTLIVGAGIIGTIYGWALAEAGHDITHLVRPGRVAQYKGSIRMDMLDNRKGHKRDYIGHYALKVTETIQVSDAYELVIIPTKPYQLIEALKQLVPLAGDADYLLLTQNWHGTAEIDAILPQSRYVFGDAKAGGAFQNGVLVSTLFDSLDLGQVDGAQGEPLKKMATLFESTGIKVVQQKNILHYIWVQYAINAGWWPAVVRAGSLAGVLGNSKIGDLGFRAVKECLDVVVCRGVNLKQYPEAILYANTSAITRMVAGVAIRLMFRFNKSVTRSSLHALGDPREIKTSFDDLLNSGKEYGVPMPVMCEFERDIEQFAGGKS